VKVQEGGVIFEGGLQEEGRAEKTPKTQPVPDPPRGRDFDKFSKGGLKNGGVDRWNHFSRTRGGEKNHRGEDWIRIVVTSAARNGKNGGEAVKKRKKGTRKHRVTPEKGGLQRGRESFVGGNIRDQSAQTTPKKTKGETPDEF